MYKGRNLTAAVIAMVVILAFPMALPAGSTPLTDSTLRSQLTASYWSPLIVPAMAGFPISFLHVSNSIALDNSNTFFFFLPPLASNPNADSNLLDRTLTNFINITICKPAAAGACVVVDKLTSLSVKAETVSLDGNHYAASWQSSNALRGSLIRIRVDVAGMILGSTELGLQSPRTIPIKFVIYNNPLVRARVLREQGRTSTFIADVLRDEFRLGAVAAAQILRDEHFTAAEIGDALKSSFGEAALGAAQILKNLGFGLLEIGSVLHFTFGQEADAAAQTLKTLGYTSIETGKVLKEIFAQNAAQSAQALRSAGYTATQTYESLTSNFLLTLGNIAPILAACGYTPGEILQVRLAVLAPKFAPVLKFDGAANTYPMSAQNYYDRIIKTGRWNNPTLLESYCKPDLGSASLFLCEPQLDGSNYSLVASNSVPTYFSGSICGNQLRIIYWWFYGWQKPCFGEFGLVAGHHNGDWERVMVTVSEDSSGIAAVTFYQHSGWLTRLDDRGGFYTEGTHPVVYVGKNQHGSYFSPERFGLIECGYWGDFRNPDDERMDSKNNLVNLADLAEPWMVADKVGGFSWGYAGVNTHPTQDPPSCALDACAGSNIFFELGTNGCWKSECKKGDTDTGIECIEDCHSGDHNSGILTCIEGCSTFPFCPSYLKRRYNYSYTLPTSDRGLLTNDH